ncbi:hypothetical protein MLD52_14285 [Puniceicoccaceae bacterium K14]|nr:hypothetical protein [Puniceicoccaceae bacterium K14]
MIEGKTPNELENPTRVANRFSIAPGQLLLQVDRVARFWVTNGNKITIQRSPDASHDDIRVYLYGTALGAAILQRGQVPLHATTVIKDDKAIAFTGASGAGKSTLAHTLINRGWKLVCDDVTVLTTTNDILHAQPGFPSIKLWRDVLEASHPDVSKLKEIRVQVDKFHWDSKSSFYAQPARLHAIIGLLPYNEESLKIESLRGFRKFKFLTRNTYRQQMIEGMADTSKIFKMWSETLEQIKFWKIHRPKSPLRPELLADAIEKLIQ